MMSSIELLWVWPRLNVQQLSRYLRVLSTDSWADVKAAVATINAEEIMAEDVWLYLDLLHGAIKGVEPLDHGRISAYFGDDSTPAKT